MQNNEDSERLRFTRGTWVRPVQTCSDQTETSGVSGVPGGEMSCWIRVLLVFVFKLLGFFFYHLPDRLEVRLRPGFQQDGLQTERNGRCCLLDLVAAGCCGTSSSNEKLKVSLDGEGELRRSASPATLSFH